MTSQVRCEKYLLAKIIWLTIKGRIQWLLLIWKVAPHCHPTGQLFAEFSHLLFIALVELKELKLCWTCIWLVGREKNNGMLVLTCAECPMTLANIWWYVKGIFLSIYFLIWAMGSDTNQEQVWLFQLRFLCLCFCPCFSLCRKKVTSRIYIHQSDLSNIWINCCKVGLLVLPRLSILSEQTTQSLWNHNLMNIKHNIKFSTKVSGALSMTTWYLNNWCSVSRLTVCRLWSLSITIIFA